MKKIVLVLWACGAAVCSGQFYFEAGPWVRGGMDLEVAGGSSAAAAGGRSLAGPLLPKPVSPRGNLFPGGLQL